MIELYKTNLAADPNLKALWRLDETSGTTAGDIIGGHNGTASRADILGHPFGVFGNHAIFSATSTDGIRIANHADFNVTGAFSLSAWIKYTNASSITYFITKGGSGGTGTYSWNLSTTATGHPSIILWQTSGGEYLRAISSSVYNDGNWHHLCGTYDGTTASIYVDGVLKGASTSKSGTWENGTSDIQLGRRGDTFGLLTGSLNDVAFFNRSLTIDDVALIYQSSEYINYLTNYRPRKRTPGAVSV